MNWEKIADRVLILALVVVACFMAARTPNIVHPKDYELVQQLNKAFQSMDSRLKALETPEPLPPIAEVLKEAEVAKK